MNYSLFSMEGMEILLRWLHYLFGIIWLGHLYYFNFTQAPFMAEADAATKSSVQQKLLPRALWWFRWGAMWTFVIGVLLIGMKAHTNPNLLSDQWGLKILTGGLLGTLMWFNVWFVIWPNQKVIIENAVKVAKGEPANPTVAGIAARATVASRTNVLFSIPMLFFMGAAMHLQISITAQSLMMYWIFLFVLLGLLEFNALKGKLGPMTKVSGVIHMGVLLTLVIYFGMEFLSK